MAVWSLREVKDLFSLGPCTSMQQEGQHGEGKTKPVCEPGACVMRGNPSWDTRAQSRGDEDHSNLSGKWPRNPRCEATPLVKSKGQQAEVTDSCGQGLSRVWKWGMCARAGTVFPHHPVFRQPWCLLTCLHPTPTANSSHCLGTHIADYIISLHF